MLEGTVHVILSSCWITINPDCNDAWTPSLSFLISERKERWRMDEGWKMEYVDGRADAWPHTNCSKYSRSRGDVSLWISAQVRLLRWPYAARWSEWSPEMLVEGWWVMCWPLPAPEGLTGQQNIDMGKEQTSLLHCSTFNDEMWHLEHWYKFWRPKSWFYWDSNNVVPENKMAFNSQLAQFFHFKHCFILNFCVLLPFLSKINPCSFNENGLVATDPHPRCLFWPTLWIWWELWTFAVLTSWNSKYVAQKKGAEKSIVFIILLPVMMNLYLKY